MPFMCFASICVTAIEIFVPVQGRGGPQNNPETLISMLCIIVGIMQCSLIVPLFSLCRRPLLILSGFLVAFIVFIIVIATPIGFPYKDEVSAQRFWIFVSFYIFSFHIKLKTHLYIAYGKNLSQFWRVNTQRRVWLLYAWNGPPPERLHCWVCARIK